MKRSLFLCLFFSMFFTAHVHAACTAGVADTCSRADFSECVTEASDGDTITIPSGSCEWTSELSIDLSAKALTITGAGVTETIILDGTDATSDVLKITVADGKSVLVQGIAWDSNGTTKTGFNALLEITGAGDDTRITDSKFTVADRGLLWRSLGGELYGLVDNSTFISEAGGNEQAISIISRGATSWGVAHTWGTRDALYIEDCTFTWDRSSDSAIDTYDGARFVARNNTFLDGAIGYHGYDTGPYRGTFQVEIYDNTHTATGAIFHALNVRGGTAKVFRNTWDSNFTGMWMTYYRSCCPIEFGTTCWTYDRCDGDSVDDGNEDASGWPCRDQPGLGVNQDKIPVYTFANTKAGANLDLARYVGWDATCTIPSMGDHITSDRDYYNSDTVQVSNSSPFDGTSGIGWGVKTNRPATCTAGTAYWATDEGGWSSNAGNLYTCDVGDDAWTLSYTPYTYPHPQRKAGTLQLSFDQTSESEIVTGGGVLTGNLSGDLLVATFAADNAITTAFIALLTGSGAEAKGIANYLVGLVDYTHVARVTATQFTVTFPAAALFDITIPDDLGSSLCDTCTEGAVEIAGDSTYPLTVNPEVTSVSPAAMGNNPVARSAGVNVNAKQIDSTP